MKNSIKIVGISMVTIVSLTIAAFSVKAHLPEFCPGACDKGTSEAVASPVTPGKAGPSASVFVNRGDDIQKLVDTHPAGTTFIIRTGTHRFQKIRPKNGNAFIGEAGAMLSGAKVLTKFSRAGKYWVASNQRQQGFVKGSCETNTANLPPGGCKFPEDLFIDNKPLFQVARLSDLGSGRWFFDYSKDKIYLSDNPSGRYVEVSFVRHAFEGNASNVTIHGLIIEKYANPTQEGAIHAMENDRDGGVGHNWIIQENEIRFNHGFGIRTGHKMKILRNHIHHNGQLGLGGAANDTLIEQNEIDHNNTQGYNFRNEAGGVKILRSRNVTMRSNYVHQNIGPGLWVDVNNVNILYEGNRLVENSGMGIFHEKSYEGIIRNNIAERNGFGFPAWLMGGGIVVSASSNVEVHGNILKNNADGIGVVQGTDKSGLRGPFVVENVFVHDNQITMTEGETGLAVSTQDASFFTSRKNRFRRNVYNLVGGKEQFFRWNNAILTEKEWRSFGEDVNGSVNRQS